MPASLDRSRLLIDQGRFDLAETEIRRSLAANSADPVAHSLLAAALSGQNKHSQAVEAAQEAVRLAPDSSYSHFVLGQVCLQGQKLKPAEQAAQEALRIDPTDADVYNLLAWLAVSRSEWQKALDHANAGLEHESDHTGCHNARAHALQMLGRAGEAHASLESTLRLAPEDSFTHANQGWNFLRSGDERKALEHFLEALRLDPHEEYARNGLLEALKARNPLYKPILAYFVWISRLSEGARWGVVIGAYLLFRFSRLLLEGSPATRTFAIVVIALYLVFLLTTWAGPTLFNLTLWLHPLGRRALSRDERLASVLCLGTFLLAAACLAGALLVPGFSGGFWWAAAFPFLCIPIAATFNVDVPGKRIVGYAICGAFLATMIAGAVLSFLVRNDSPGPLLAPAAIGLALFTWFGNLILRPGS